MYRRCLLLLRLRCMASNRNLFDFNSASPKILGVSAVWLTIEEGMLFYRILVGPNPSIHSSTFSFCVFFFRPRVNLSNNPTTPPDLSLQYSWKYYIVLPILHAWPPVKRLVFVSMCMCVCVCVLFGFMFVVFLMFRFFMHFFCVFCFLHFKGRRENKRLQIGRERGTRRDMHTRTHVHNTLLLYTNRHKRI